MSLTQNNKVLWSDIKAMYDNLNRSRTKFSVNGQSFPTISPSDYTNKPAQAQQIVDLKAAIEELKASKYVGDTASVPAAPTVATLLKPVDFNSQLNEIYNKCVHDTSNFTFSVCSCVAFPFGFCSFDPSSASCPSDFTSNAGCPSDFTSNAGCTSDFTSNAGCPSDFTSNAGCPSDFSSFNGFLFSSGNFPFSFSGNKTDFDGCWMECAARQFHN